MKKILMVILTFSVLILPGFSSAAPGELLLVQSASHSGNVSTPVPEEDKDCAQHLADLMNEGMAIVETSSLDAIREAEKIQATAAVMWAAAFHLSNASSRNPKAAIIVCGKLEQNPDNPDDLPE